jgi:putative ABC transport system substrate-binding protein
MFNPDTAPGGGSFYLRSFEAAALTLNLTQIVARVHSDLEVQSVIVSLGREPGGGLVVMGDSFMTTHRAPIILLAARNNVPTVYYATYFVRDGGLFSYGPDFGDIYRRAAAYVDRILRAANPADLPVQLPVKFEMAVNLKTAKALGLTVPQSILLRADEVIE